VSGQVDGEDSKCVCRHPLSFFVVLEKQLKILQRDVFPGGFGATDVGEECLSETGHVSQLGLGVLRCATFVMTNQVTVRLDHHCGAQTLDFLVRQLIQVLSVIHVVQQLQRHMLQDVSTEVQLK